MKRAKEMSGRTAARVLVAALVLAFGAGLIIRHELGLPEQQPAGPVGDGLPALTSTPVPPPAPAPQPGGDR